MKRIVIIALLLLSFVLSFSSFIRIEKHFSQNNICIRIANNSLLKLDEVSIFSLPIGNIESKGKSNYVILNFNDKSDNAILQLKFKNKFFALYVSPNFIDKGKYTYIIDSINLENRFIHLRRIKD